MKQTKAIVLKPSSLSEMSFSREAATFKELLEKKVELTAQRKSANTRLTRLLKKYKVEEESKLSELVIYKKPKIATHSDEYSCGKSEGYHFENLSTNLTVMRILEKRFGKELVEFVRNSASFYESSFSTKEADGKKTAAVRKLIKGLLAKVEDLDSQIEVISEKISNIREYLSFCKDLSALASTKTIKNSNNQ